MALGDVMRYLAFISSGLSFTLALAVLVVSFLVLHPKPLNFRTMRGSPTGFLFIHVLAVTIAFQGMVIWGIHEVYTRLTHELTFRPVALLTLTGLMNLGYYIIFQIELSRYQMKVRRVTD